jgi:phosphatidylglycerophosphate synthase
MRNLPNIITSVRLICALILIMLSLNGAPGNEVCFLPLFCAAGFSDMLDGWTARRFNWCTDFGARLDSVSDLLLYLSVVAFFSIYCAVDMCRCAGFFALGGLIQLAHWYFSVRKLGGFPAYHSGFSRGCAYFLFFCVIAYWRLRWGNLIPSMVLVWCACSIEGIVITSLLRSRCVDVSSIKSALSFAESAAKESRNF